MLTKTARDSRVIAFAYDQLDRLTDRTVPGAPTHSANGRTVSHDFTYDLAGRRLTASHDGLTLALAYDAAGRVLSQSHGGVLPVSYAYDQAGNVSKLTYPDGFDVDFVYDALSRVTTAKDGARTLATVAYDQQSRRQSVTYDNGTSAAYAISLRGDLTDHDLNFAGTADNADYTFTYNGVGQLLTESVFDAALQWQPGANQADSYVANGLR